MSTPKTITAWAAGIIAVLVIAYFAMDLGGVFTQHQQAVNARIAKNTATNRVTQKVYDPNSVIANYERFHDDCRSVVAMTQQIASAQQALTSARADAKAASGVGALSAQQAVGDAESNLNGLEQQRASVAQGYNSRSAQYTRNKFKTVSLPYRIGPPDGSPYDAVNCG